MDGAMVRLSTVLFSGKSNAAIKAFATVCGDIIFVRGAVGQRVLQISVSVAPGNRAITRIPFGRSSSRSVLVRPRAPCLEAL